MPVSYTTPNVYITEQDKSEVIAQEGNSGAGFVIAAKYGPVNRKIKISNERDYLATFGSPIADTAGVSSKVLSWGYNSYAALYHLAAGGAVEVVRASTSNDSYSFAALSNAATTSATSAIWINQTAQMTSGIKAIYSSSATQEDKIDYIVDIEYATNAVVFSSATSAKAAAIFSLNGPGDNANGYSVDIESISSVADWKFAYDDYSISSAVSDPTPGIDGTFATNGLVAGQIVKIYVYNTVGGSVPVEVFYGSFNPSLMINGQSMYLPDVINGNSSIGLYCRVIDATALNTSAVMVPWKGASTYATAATLFAGTSTSAAALAISSGYKYFKTSNNAYIVNANPEDFDTGSAAAQIVQVTNKLQNLTAIVQVGGTVDTARTNSITYKNNISSSASAYVDSYAGGYTGFSQIKDSYTGKIIWLPNAVMGLYTNALTDSVANVWDAPAGDPRGTVACIDQAPNWTSDEVGDLYSLNWNSVLKFPGSGFFIWGQKTRQRKKSALDRLQTRKTLNVIKNTLASAFRPIVLTENNTPGLRTRVQNNTNDYFAGLMAAGGLTYGKCICDDTNNTPQVIDNHVLAVTCIVQPVQAVEYALVTLIITRTGVSVTEALAA